jgi:transcriptional regulator with XRE-family HTH domain
MDENLSASPEAPDGYAIVVSMTTRRTIGLDTTGERIQWLRKRKGFTQVELAKQLGISNVFLSDMEKGIKPPIERVVQLAQLLGTTSDFLLLLTDDPMPRNDEDEPVYFSAEADEIARMIDSLPTWKRVETLYMLRAAVAYNEEAIKRAEAVADDIQRQLKFSGSVVGGDVARAISDALARAWTGAPDADE